MFGLGMNTTFCVSTGGYNWYAIKYIMYILYCTVGFDVLYIHETTKQNEGNIQICISPNVALPQALLFCSQLPNYPQALLFCSPSFCIVILLWCSCTYALSLLVSLFVKFSGQPVIWAVIVPKHPIPGMASSCSADRAVFGQMDIELSSTFTFC